MHNNKCLAPYRKTKCRPVANMCVGVCVCRLRLLASGEQFYVVTSLPAPCLPPSRPSPFISLSLYMYSLSPYRFFLPVKLGGTSSRPLPSFSPPSRSSPLKKQVGTHHHHRHNHHHHRRRRRRHPIITII